jgi:hypothetical protein
VSLSREQLAVYAEIRAWAWAATSSGDPVRHYLEWRTGRGDDWCRMRLPVPVPDYRREDYRREEGTP